MLHPLLPVSKHNTCTHQHSTNDTVLIFVNKKVMKYMTLRKMYCGIMCFGQGRLGGGGTLTGAELEHTDTPTICCIKAESAK
jgi:hypothetical protein